MFFFCCLVEETWFFLVLRNIVHQREKIPCTDKIIKVSTQSNLVHSERTYATGIKSTDIPKKIWKCLSVLILRSSREFLITLGIYRTSRQSIVSEIMSWNRTSCIRNESFIIRIRCVCLASQQSLLNEFLSCFVVYANGLKRIFNYSLSACIFRSICNYMANMWFGHA